MLKKIKEKQDIFDRLDKLIISISPLYEIQLLRVIKALISVICFALTIFLMITIIFWIGIIFYIACLFLYLEGF